MKSPEPKIETPGVKPHVASLCGRGALSPGIPVFGPSIHHPPPLTNMLTPAQQVFLVAGIIALSAIIGTVSGILLGAFQTFA